MDLIREIVSGPKNRLKQNGFNLDLTYITPRIIAMAFPASGIQKLYRNSIDTIAQLLETYHQNKYLTINISGRKIDEQVLRNVMSFQWEDHKVPPFSSLFVICQAVARYLAQDSERIAVFHCNHGKGRTGTIICCFFLYMGIFQQTKRVMEFYGKRRFKREDYGVTQPCQISYIKYFEKYTHKQDYFPEVLSIKKITFKGSFNNQDLYVKIVDKNGKIAYNTKSLDSSLRVEKTKGLKQYSIIFTQKHAFAGDITLQLKQNRLVGKNLLISYFFSTAFIDCSQPVYVQLKEMSPLGHQVNFQKDFVMEIEFRKVCSCGSLRNVSGCQKCKGILEEEFPKWQKIKQACMKRQLLMQRAQQISFGEEMNRA